MGESEYVTRGATVLLPGGLTPLVGSDSRRVALIVTTSAIGATVWIVATGAPDASHKVWLSNTTPLVLTYRDVGPLVSYAWSAEAMFPGAEVAAVEVLYTNRKG